MKEKYGNGTHTEYSYDPARRWLRTIKTQNRSGVPFQNMSYEFDLVGNVKGYENDCLDGGRGNYKTSQNYEYDALYQLTRAYGETTHDPYKSLVPDFKSTYEQVFEFDGDGLGNMMKKVSSETVTPRKTIGDNLNYTFDYEYDEKYAHRLIHAGNLYYQYDDNGNVTCEQDGSFESNGDDVKYHKISEEADGVYSSDYGWGLFRDSDSGKNNGRYRRTYTWNERNQLICSQDSSYTTNYIYGQDGQRSNKYTTRSETLYFNKMWTLHTDSGNSVYGGQTGKNIYLGDTRIVTKLASPNVTATTEEYYKQYYYHSDHLGSASLISDYKGDEYQRIEYTPYGETWVEKTQNTGLEYLPYKFTGQEKDEETGNYYIGARYLCPRTSRWLSCDPALGDYMEKTKEGEGGIYNSANLNLYSYAANSPVSYVDPSGKIIAKFDTKYTMQAPDWKNENIGNSKNDKMESKGCFVTSIAMVVTALTGNKTTPSDINAQKDCFSGSDLGRDEIASQYNLAADYWTQGGQGDLADLLTAHDNSLTEYGVIGKVAWDPKDSKTANHWVGITGRPFKDKSLGKGYFVEITGSSDNDKPSKRPKGWVEKNGKTYISTKNIERIYTFTKKQNQE